MLYVGIVIPSISWIRQPDIIDFSYPDREKEQFSSNICYT